MISGYFLARKYYFYSRIWVTVYSAISFATVFLLFSIEIVSEKMIYKYFAYFCYYAPVFGVYGGWYFGKHSINRTPTYWNTEIACPPASWTDSHELESKNVTKLARPIISNHGKWTFHKSQTSENLIKHQRTIIAGNVSGRGWSVELQAAGNTVEPSDTDCLCSSRSALDWPQYPPVTTVKLSDRS